MKYEYQIQIKERKGDNWNFLEEYNGEVEK